MRYVNVILLSVLIFIVPGKGLAWIPDHTLDDTGAPTSSASAMYTLEDIYNRLGTGAAGAKRTGPFTEPSVGPAPTGHTLDHVMGVAPAVDDANGASVGDVLAGKTFWGLTTGAWGLQTGTGAILTDPAPVPITGQTISYATGDDGDLQKGVPWPSPRWTCYDVDKNVVACDNTDRVVATDNLTGLMWTTNANLYSQINWSQALSECDTNTAGGYTDWRLPNVKELQSLIDFGRYDPALSLGHPFTGVQSDGYWSSSTGASYTEHAWLVGLGNGYVSLDDKAGSDYVWPVRGGQEGPR